MAVRVLMRALLVLPLLSVEACAGPVPEDPAPVGGPPIHVVPATP